MSEITPGAGAHNLLRNCAGLRADDRVVIAYEPSEFGYYDRPVVPIVATAAARLSLRVDTVDIGFNPEAPCLSAGLLERCQFADAILFLARLGDQLRFSDMPPGKKIVVSYAVTRELLGSHFSRADYDSFKQLKECVDSLQKTPVRFVLEFCKRDIRHALPH